MEKIEHGNPSMQRNNALGKFIDEPLLNKK
jgi:hypothetical protein